MITSSPPLPNELPAPGLTTRHLARIVFTVFLLTFIAARILVLLIMTRRMPDLFLHTHTGTHVHHLNYGIFLLSLVGALLVFIQRPNERLRKICALLYGFGMALTFDEFGMWLHLGGSYWQRGSFDAVIVVLSFFGVMAFMPPLSRMRAHHWTTGAITVAAVTLFYVMLFTLSKDVGKRIGPRLLEIEEAGPQ